MALAIFGISNDGLNLVVNLLALMLVAVWLALIVYTYLDAKRRVSDPFLIACATLASFIPYLGTAVYAIVRPPEFLEDAHERELEIRAAELRVRQLEELTCKGCGYPIERSYLRCPQCQRRLKDPCPACGKPVDPRWSLCPHCETPLSERERPRRQRPTEGGKPPREARKPSGEEPPRVPREERRPPKRAPERTQPAPPPRPAAKEPANPKRPQRSPSRESDPDPRQA